MLRYTLLQLLFFLLTPLLIQAQVCTPLSDNFNLGGDDHASGFQENDAVYMAANLSNGHFIVTWETRDGVDGDGNGGFFQIFEENGTPVTDVLRPYTDVNPAGTGDQGTPGPKVIALETGFVIGWTSEDGPGDTGPVDEDNIDAFFRVYANDGTPISGSVRLNLPTSEEFIEALVPLSNGGFLVLLEINEDALDGRDDLFFRAFDASGNPIANEWVEVSGGLQAGNFQNTDFSQSVIELENNRFAITWEARDGADGDREGGYFRIFNLDGTAVTDLIVPYADINPDGTGDQAVPGPKMIRLENGNLVLAWSSERGPGDAGMGDPDDQIDVYFRIYSPSGMPITGTTKANSDNQDSREDLSGLVALKGGNFVILYHIFEDTDTPFSNNTSNYYVRTFSPSGNPVSATIEISGGAHVDYFSTIPFRNQAIIALNNGNFAVGWAARDGADGDDAGIYYRVFDGDGTPFTNTATPYADINPNGTGKQSTFGPIIETLPNGFVIAWQSADGPGDVGPMAGHNQDIYHRVYDNDGFFLCGSTKTNSGNDAAEEVLLFVHPLSSGDFAIMYKDQEEHPGNNKDDYFVRVTGGTPPPLVCPSLGTLVSSEFSICQTESSQFTISGLENMGASFNNSQNFGISFVAFNDPTINPYNGGEVLGVVPFNDLGSGGTTATLNASFNNPDPSLYIYALLSPAPDDGDCRPSSLATLSVNAFPIIDFPNLGTSCINAGIQAGLGQATPTGGTYSGPGVTNDGNGQTFTFDPTVAGLGIKLIMYSISANGCTSNFSSFIEVVDAPNVSFTAPDDLMINAGVQMGLGGGMPAQGSASGDQGSYAGPGVTDDGNGQSYSFDPSAAGLGVHTVTYTYTDANGCTAMASDEVEVLPAPLVISPIDDINDLDMDGNGVSVGQMVAVQGIVHCSDFAVNEAIWFWIMEANGDGIGVFANETVDNYVVMEGDELIIEGMVEQFQGLLEINPSKITVLSQNNDLLDPIPVNTLTEALESKWVRLDIPGVAPSEIQIEEIGNDILVNFPLDNQQTLTINALSATGITRPFLESFINASTDGTFQITGIVAQQDLQVPYDDFYQLFVCSEGSFDFVVGTEEPTWASEIQLFPNPTNAQLQIQAPVLIEALRLIDLQGRVIYEERVRDRQHQLDMRPFAAGLYQLQLISDGAVANRAVVRM